MTVSRLWLVDCIYGVAIFVYDICSRIGLIASRLDKKCFWYFWIFKSNSYQILDEIILSKLIAPLYVATNSMANQARG